MFLYNRQTGRPVWQSGVTPEESRAKAVWVLGAGPFQRGTIYQGTKFAGDRLNIPLIDPATRPMAAHAWQSTTRPSSWSEREAHPTPNRHRGQGRGCFVEGASRRCARYDCAACRTAPGAEPPRRSSPLLTRPPAKPPTPRHRLHPAQATRLLSRPNRLPPVVPAMRQPMEQAGRRRSRPAAAADLALRRPAAPVCGQLREGWVEARWARA